MRLRFTLVLIALALPTPASTQNRTRTPSATNDIIVTGTALPSPPGTAAYGTVEIGRERLTGDASGRVEDVLKDVAGFQQFRRSDSRSANPSAQGATLRALGGNASSRTLVLLDGVPIADPFFGFIPFDTLAGERLSTARVTRGGGSGPFGAGAVAGTIELTSATRAELPTVAASAFYGSFDTATLSASVAPDLGDGFLSASARHERSDGFFTSPATARGPADARARFEDWSGEVRAVAPLDAQTDLQARLSLFRDNRTLRFRGADSSSEGQDASVRLVRRGRWQIDALAYLQARNFSNIVVSATNFRKTLDQRNTPSTGFGGKIELRPPLGVAHVFRIGIDARLADGELFEDAYSTATGLITARRNAGGKTGSVGAFLEDDWTLGALVLTGGIRGDRWTISDGFFNETSAAGVSTIVRRFPDRHGFESTGRVGALLHANRTIALRGAAYAGFRLPTLNELYRPFVVFPITTQANEALGLEKLKGIEAGIDLTPARGFTVNATAFYNRLDNAIANVTIGPNLRQRRNVDAIVARGIELTADIHRGPFALNASYAFSDSRVRARGTALDGFRPAQTARHMASVTVGWTPRIGPSLSATVRYVGKQFEDDLETDILPDALTVDGVARLPVGKHFAVVARVENLFDEKIVTRNSGGSIDLGTPQTFWIGMRFD